MNPPKFKIREASITDARQILKVRREASLKAYVNQEVTRQDIEANNDEKKLDMLQDMILGDQSKFWVAEVDKQIVGMCAAVKNPSHNRIMLWYVLPNFQGMGIGKSLWVKAIKYLGDSKDIMLEVAAANSRQQSFYESQGFTKEKEQDWLLETGKTIPEIVMRRPKS